MSRHKNVSVVMALYHKDKPEWFKEAVDSMLNQTRKANDIVIVVDGPIGEGLSKALATYEKNPVFNIVRLPENKGLGNALNIGIKEAKNELIARMDSDDISVSNRLELQVKEFNENPNLDILGGQLAEFIGDIENVVAHRIVPTTYAGIIKFSKRRSPFNHPTVMYKKSVIEKLGGYDVAAIRVEDYDLWLRAISKNSTCVNTHETLLYYRATTNSMRRRKTLSSLKSHIKSRLGFYKKGYISRADLLYGVISQVVLFITPVVIANTVLRKVFRGA